MLYRISLTSILARFKNSNLARTTAGFGENLFSVTQKFLIMNVMVSVGLKRKYSSEAALLSLSASCWRYLWQSNVKIKTIRFKPDTAQRHTKQFLVKLVSQYGYSCLASLVLCVINWTHSIWQIRLEICSKPDLDGFQQRWAKVKLLVKLIIFS